MNTLQATITSIKRREPLHYLQCQVGKQTIAMLSLQIDRALSVGSDVLLSVKSTDIMVTKEQSIVLSSANCLHARVTKVENGELLSSVILDMEGMALESIMTQEASQQLALSAGDVVSVLIKESDVSLC